MPIVTCTVVGCTKPTRGRKWCSAHYRRFYKYGDPTAEGPGKDWARRLPVEPRLMAGLVPVGDCLEWQGAKSEWGYGVLQVDARRKLVHRAMYELKFGPIPDGMLIMHTCDNPPCARPEHLRLGTDALNGLDRDLKGRNFHSNKTHCPQGHVYDEENTRLDHKGKRLCITCRRTQAREAYWRRKTG